MLSAALLLWLPIFSKQKPIKITLANFDIIFNAILITMHVSNQINPNDLIDLESEYKNERRSHCRAS